MGITMSFIGIGFLCWLIIRQRLRSKIGNRAAAVFLLCLGAGLVVGLWADGDTIRTITHAMYRGPVPRY